MNKSIYIPRDVWTIILRYKKQMELEDVREFHRKRLNYNTIVTISRLREIIKHFNKNSSHYNIVRCLHTIQPGMYCWSPVCIKSAIVGHDFYYQISKDGKKCNKHR